MAGIVASETAQMKRLLTARMYLYTLFHKAFGGTPNAEFLEAVCGEATQDALGEYAQESSELARVAEFFAGLAGADEDPPLAGRGDLCRRPGRYDSRYSSSYQRKNPSS